LEPSEYKGDVIVPILVFVVMCKNTMLFGMYGGLFDW